MSDGVDLLAALHKENGKIQLLYCLIACTLLVLFGLLVSWKFVWILGIAAGVLSSTLTRAKQKKRCQKLVRNRQEAKPGT